MSDAAAPKGEVSARSGADGIEIVRIFDAPRDEVFKAWTEGERFATWFGEHGSSIPADKVSMDPRPGGAWNATMVDTSGGNEHPFSGQFREVVEPERVVMTVTDAPDAEGREPEILTAVFRDLGNGRTEMTFTQTGGNLPADEYERAMKGWQIFFERLGEHLKTRHDQET
jgi:uncharacterized protein YndB with AHSA1/START domain